MLYIRIVFRSKELQVHSAACNDGWSKANSVRNRTKPVSSIVSGLQWISIASNLYWLLLIIYYHKLASLTWKGSWIRLVLFSLQIDVICFCCNDAFKHTFLFFSVFWQDFWLFDFCSSYIYKKAYWGGI